MRRIYCLFVLVLSMCQFAFMNPNFSGRWVYDSAASTLPCTGDRTILHSGNMLRITNEWNSRIYARDYILDGLEHSQVAQSGSRLKYRAVLNGLTLHIIGSLNLPRQRLLDQPIDDTYVLSDDMNAITHFTTLIGPKGPFIGREVFRSLRHVLCAVRI